MGKQKYTNMNRFFGDIIDSLLKYKLEKDENMDNENYLCDIDYVYRHLYDKCTITNQVKKQGILGNKWTQYKHFVNWCKKNNKKVPDYIPKTYFFNKTNMTKEKIKLLKSLFVNNKKWIVKPQNASFRAGIHVVNSYKKLEKSISNYLNTKWIIQDYIDNPLKIENKKIHLRIYVLMIKTKDFAQVLVFNKGYIFLSKTVYDGSSLDDDSNLSGGDSKEQMRLYPHKIVKDYGIETYKKILKQINVIVKDTMEATIDNLTCINNSVDKYKCYKFLGYDMLVTDKSNDYKIYLAEINSRTVNVKFPIKNMYDNLLSIVLNKSKKPLSNKYLFENNLNFYSVIKRIYNKHEE